MPDTLPPIVVLCGGLGTRLRTAVADRPKVLADVAGLPFLAHLLDRLAAQGAQRIVLSAGYRADQIVAFLNAAPAPGLDVTLVAETEPLGTGGALRFARDASRLVGPFLALNGDTFFSGDLAHLASARGDAPVALAVVRVPDVRRYGSVQFDEAAGAAGAPVTAFEEKGRTGSGWINAGAYALSADSLDVLAPGQPASFEREVLVGLTGQARAVPYPAATFLDIGTPDDYARAARFLTAAPDS